jgi:hypothetical protein
MVSRRALAGLALAAALATAAAAEEPWLEIATPADGARLRQVVPLVEVAGRAGLAGILRYDVALAIDFSGSSLYATGVDVDGDGVVGVDRYWTDVHRPRTWTTDWDDTIIRAELLAAIRLLERLDPETTRAGLVTFAARARRRAAVGPPADVLDVIPRLPVPHRPKSTSIARAIETSLAILEEAPAADGDRRKVILMLSDGVPTTPPPLEKAEAKALEASDAARRAGVLIHTFALGPEAMRETDVYEQIARRTGGRLTPVESPGAVVDHLPRISLAGLESISLRNAATGAEAEALRSFPDGSFDGYVRLVPGENRIEVDARMEDGRAARAARRVVFECPEEPSDEERADGERLIEALRLRTLKLELGVQARQRSRQERDLEMAIEDAE